MAAVLQGGFFLSDQDLQTAAGTQYSQFAASYWDWDQYSVVSALTAPWLPTPPSDDTEGTNCSQKPEDKYPRDLRLSVMRGTTQAVTLA